MDQSKNQEKSVISTPRARLNANLPPDQIRILKKIVSKKANVTTRTIYRVLAGISKNFEAIQAFADLLKCSTRQFLDPKYEFVNPNLTDPDNPVKVAGLVKEEAA